MQLVGRSAATCTTLRLLPLLCVPDVCADVSASSSRSPSPPTAMDVSVEEALHIAEESLHERAAVRGRGQPGSPKQSASQLLRPAAAGWGMC